MTYQFRKIISLFFIISITIFSLVVSYNEDNIDNLAYVVALGIDVSENNNLKLTFQLSTSQDSGSEGGSSSQSDTSTLTTIEAASIDSGINLLNSYLSKKVNMSHCKVLVFSEELASRGISREVFTLMNDIEVRPTSNVIICRCNAEYFLKSSKPVLEKLSARYYEIAPSSSEYTGYTENITLGMFFDALNDDTRECSAILGGVNNGEIKASNATIPNSERDSSYKANETSITNATNIENMGLAVFSGDKIVGELNGIETICHLIITNKMEKCNITIANPFDEDNIMDLGLTARKKPKINVELINGTPYISLDVFLDATIYSIDQDANLLDNENIKIIEKYANSYMSDQLYRYLYRTSKVLKSDISGFGKYVTKDFLVLKDWKEYNWLANYQNSFFDVNVDINVQSGHLLMST